VARLFGTDGVRGLANGQLTAELALDLSVAAAQDLGVFVSPGPLARDHADLEGLDGLLDLRQLLLGLGEGVGVALLGGHLDHQAEVLDPGLQRHEPVELALQQFRAP